MNDLNSLAEKLEALELTENEADALNGLLTAGAGTDGDVSGFSGGLQKQQQTMLQRQQQSITGPDLAGLLTGSGLFSMAGTGTELFSAPTARTE